MSERITWLMSVRNSMPYLRETLASITAQTYTNYEMLVWDHESEDGTLDELRRWIPSRIPGTVLTGSSSSLGKNLAVLVERAQTELCARIDGDDVNEPTRLEKQVAYMLAHPEVVALGAQVRLIDAHGDPLAGRWECPLADAEARWRTRWQSGLAHPAVLFRRDAILRAGNYRDIPSEDSELWIRLCPFGQIYSLPDVLLSYRRHGSSVSSGFTNYYECQLRSARYAAEHLFPGLDAEQSLALWRLTHPEEVFRDDAPVRMREIRLFSKAARLLARKCGKPDDYFKNTRTFREQMYWLRRRWLRGSGLLAIVDARHSIRPRCIAPDSGAEVRTAIYHP